MLRSLLVIAVTAIAGLGIVSSASADKPIREPLFLEDFELEGFCSFPVLLEVIANKEFVTVFSDGRIHVTGKLFVRLTNLDETDQVLDLNISGPAVISPDSERVHGRGLYLAFPQDASGPGIFLSTGRVDVIRGEDGFVENLRVRGTFVDVCAMLAA
jgi:hypothetical protein